MSAIYIDSSAFVKLIVHEPGSDDVRDFLAGERGRFVSSALLRTEALRAAGRHGAEALAGARAGLRRLDLIAVDDDILDAAGVLEPGIVRSLDAIHVATALTLGDDLDVLVTFDERMVAASASLGIPTATPG